jgi:2-isopropylmalate synthase
MQRFDHRRYRPFPSIDLPDRQWPSRRIEQAPQWCSVDLRDGNQALIEPMTVAQKLQLFDLLVGMGFKQIEVGFPAASAADYDFVRTLIDEQRIPDDVAIQVLVQAREVLIEKTFAALKGAKKAVVHVYNSTSKVQRDKVFGLDKAAITKIAVDGATMLRDYAAKHPDTEWTFEYSPESFSGTEVDFAVEVCAAVMDIWQPTAEKPCIINLPATVEMSTPNIYADQIEYFIRKLPNREAAIISLHTHNDRGCAVAAAELGVLAGADRVEGTLLGNGERTGNMDIITMAMNLYTQGIDPMLDLADMAHIVREVEDVTRISLHPRHPYAGELVYTAFSGSHQDAIRKCLAQQEEKDAWDVAYLPLDPSDLGRDYQEVIRINSQSGKGGITYVLEQMGYSLPRWLQLDFSRIVQQHADSDQKELTPSEILALFQQHYGAVAGERNHEAVSIEACIATLQPAFEAEISLLQLDIQASPALQSDVAYIKVATGEQEFAAVACAPCADTAAELALRKALGLEAVESGSAVVVSA